MKLNLVEKWIFRQILKWDQKKKYFGVCADNAFTEKYESQYLTTNTTKLREELRKKGESENPNKKELDKIAEEISDAEAIQINYSNNLKTKNELEGYLDVLNSGNI